jgi:DNA-binding winged helix-turn-helix (wHTH) protein/tetratricopeptide (TPR) repeat protein
MRGVYRFGPFRLDIERRLLQRDGAELALQPKVLHVLSYLVRHAGRVISRDELIAALWPGRFVTDNALSKAVKSLRRTLADDPLQPRFLRTHARVGYCFIAEVLREPAADPVPSPPEEVIAVLPFRTLSRSGGDQAVELGMAETLITLLCRLPGLRVRPLDAVRRHQGPLDDPLAVGQELNASLVLEGSIQQSSEDLRVSARVHRVSDGSVLVAQSWTGSTANLFDLQDALGRRVAAGLRSALSLEGVPLPSSNTVPRQSAYRHYLLGRLHWARHAAGSDQRALEHHRRAVELDPKFAPAWAGVAECWIRIGSLGEFPEQAYNEARHAAQQALRIDPEEVTALSCMGIVSHALDRNWGAAEGYFRRALELSPRDTLALAWTSDFLAYQGRAEEAIDYAARALENDPSAPWLNMILGQALHMARMHQDAIRQAEHALQLAPDYGFANFFLGLSLLAIGRTEDALSHIERAWRLTDRADFAGALGFALGRAGRRQEAKTLLSLLEQRATERPVPPFSIGMIHAGLGEEDEAFKWFERCLSEKCWHTIILHAEPGLAYLRDDPRTVELLSRIGIHARPMPIAAPGHPAVTKRS